MVSYSDGAEELESGG